jgi:hypothetical protein
MQIPEKGRRKVEKEGKVERQVERGLERWEKGVRQQLTAWAVIHLLWLGVDAPVAVQVPSRKRAFLEFSLCLLCLSRACLGKQMTFIYKWLKKPVFLT